MFIDRRGPRLTGAAIVFMVVIAGDVASVHAQSDRSSAAAQHDHPAPAAGARAAHDMSATAREGSGTSWLPDSSPMYMLHAQRGPWMLMGHENVFLQYLHDAGARGDDQAGSVNWVMGMAQRNAGSGHVGFRGMFSLEPWTIRGCGYPDLLASGEQCRGETIHDRQHPHDLPMEVSAEYDAPIAGNVRWQVYGGPAAEPALGPAAYPHRVSAMANPLAPISHHWLDSTHITYGVVTGGVYATRWKVESSAFNGREPDDRRRDFDFGALDSISGRIWFLPASSWALQVSGGRLKEAEAGELGGPRVDVRKMTATALYHRVHDTNVWASTFGWGRNAEGGHATNALLIETSLAFEDRDTWFGRAEIAGKTPHDLDVTSAAATLMVTKLQGGYTRYLPAGRGFRAGLGAELSVGFVPKELKPTYGARANLGAGVFFTLRPAMMSVDAHAAHGPASGGAAAMVMVQTAFDPAKLTCPRGFDPKTATRATYEGLTYYFCSAEDRDKFMTDPKMSLSMMPPRQ
jgi:YHS domain-containing protein